MAWLKNTIFLTHPFGRPGPLLAAFRAFNIPTHLWTEAVEYNLFSGLTLCVSCPVTLPRIIWKFQTETNFDTLILPQIIIFWNCGSGIRIDRLDGKLMVRAVSPALWMPSLYRTLWSVFLVKENPCCPFMEAVLGWDFDVHMLNAGLLELCASVSYLLLSWPSASEKEILWQLVQISMAPVWVAYKNSTFLTWPPV